MLIADGRTVTLQERMRTSDCSYVSLSGLGYRDWLRGSPHVAAAEVEDLVRAG